MRRFLVSCAAVVEITVCSVSPAQIRFVTYNTLDKPYTSTDDALLRTIFQAIAQKEVNGVAKRVDVVALQEQTLLSGENSAARFAAQLNQAYGVSSYSWSSRSTGQDRLAFVYDTATVSPISDQLISVGTRPGHVIGFQPIGYSSPQASFYAYSLHLKASTGDSNVAQRNLEATNVRNHVAGLGAGANAIVAGDLNVYSPTEDAFVTFTESGSGQVRDPLQLSSWATTASRRYLTQSTRTGTLPDGGSSGGVDDRFDHQLITPSLLDGEGLSYIGPTSTGLGALQHSLQAFGNDGTSYNQNITSPTTGRSQPTSVLNALYNFSDHLPVVADYQLPAVLNVATAQAPSTLNLGEVFSLDVLIRNAANVVAVAGADELDWVLSASGSLSGAASGTSFALAAASAAQVFFDTSTLGMKTGTLLVSTASQAAANSSVSIPFSYEVVASGVVGDFNDDGFVDAADYTVWRDTFATEGVNLPADADGNGIVNLADYHLWRDQFGASSAISAGTAVPEPGSITIVTVIVLAVAAPRVLHRATT